MNADISTGAFHTELIDYDFGKEVKLNPVKKVFSKLMFFILKNVIK